MKNYQLTDPTSIGIHEDRLTELRERASKEVDEGLLPAAQIALAKDGKLVHFQTFGDADNDSLFCIFSATKAITSAAVWLLIQDGKLDISKKVADLIPEFAENNKGEITIEQLLTHTAGFPHAPFRVEDWLDYDRRLERFATWRLTWEPGSRFEYHPTSSMWVLGEIIERISGITYDEFIRSRISEPLGLGDLWVGMPEAEHARIATICHVGNALTEDDYKSMGLPVPPVTEVTESTIDNFNRTVNRTTPVPGGGGIMSAADLALFYQALIGNLPENGRLWSAELISNVTRPRTGDFKDMTTGAPCNRALGVVVAGDKRRNHRGFGHTNSEFAFGHQGAGGQIAWVDPATGISFSYVTNAHDRNAIRQARRCISISNKAAVCA